MGWQDRSYSGDDNYGSQMRIGFRRPSSVVTCLLIINVAFFFIDVLSQNWGGSFFRRTFGLHLTGLQSLYFWQPISYMFIHGGTFHLLFNMLGLYVFGSEFERAFGSRRFLQFYFLCGIVGGAAYIVFSLFSPQHAHIPLVGASGGVYGLLIAAIIFFPHVQVILFLIPMPVRIFGLILAAILLLQVIAPGGVDNLGGEICHMAGAATALATFYMWGMLPQLRLPGIGISRKEGAWARRQQKLAEEQAEVDRILLKVHREGLQSLSRKEKKTLTRATQRQRERDRELDRVHRF